jgi:SAM-dependent methyltransferase
MENKNIKIECPNCGGGVVFWGSKKNYKLFICNDCKLIFVHPIPDLVSIYNEDYFSGAGGGFGYVNYDEDKEPMVPVFNKYLDLFDKYKDKKGRLLDIGAATGFFLKLAKNRGYEVSGVEMSDHAAKEARRAGIDVITGDLLSNHYPDQFFDIITMLDVLEHFTDPFVELSEVKRILKTKGLLVVNTPNGQSLLARILKTNWHLVIPPEHLFYFSPKNLEAFLVKNGFSILYSGTIGKHFTLQYIFKMLYKWQKIEFWNILSKFFSKGLLSKIHIPINLHDNFFLIAEKNEK